MGRLAIIILGLLVCLATAPARAAGFDAAAAAGALVTKGDALVAAYQSGAKASDGFSDLYFDDFEASGLEADIGAHDAGRKTGLESRFSRLISLAGHGAPEAEVRAVWQELRAELEVVAGSASSGSGWAVFLQAALILLREGFEALLVVTALAAYVRRTGNADKLRVLYAGVGWAVVASVITAVVVTKVLGGVTGGQSTIEGVTMLFAAAVLFYVSCWLFAKSEASRWQAFVKAQVDRALTGGGAFALGLAVFLAVYREGAETVLFYQALSIGSPGHEAALFGGIATGLIGLAGLYWLMRSASLRLPLGPFFAGTAGLLFLLSVVFVGQGVLELQEARWLSATPVPWLPEVSWLGLFPTVETAGAQGLVLAAALAGALWFGAHRTPTQSADGGEI